MSSVDIKTARAAKRHLIEDFSGNPAINGIGIKPVDGGYVVKVNLFKPTPGLELPPDVDGVDVQVEITGPGFPQVA